MDTDLLSDIYKQNKDVTNTYTARVYNYSQFCTCTLLTHVIGYSKILTCTKGTHNMGSQYINEIIVMLLSHSEPLQLAVAHDRLCHLLHVLLIV